jgi:Ca-activated chloride channel homolog
MNKWLKILISVVITIIINIALVTVLYFSIESFRFYSPYFLLLLLLIPFIILNRNEIFFKRNARMTYSSIEHAKKVRPSLRIRLRPALFFLRILFFSLLIYAMARPQAGIKETEIETEGVDIVLAVDVSTSMRAEDFKPNRLEAVKRVLKEFINNRNNDRIGLTIFAGQSFTQCPLTLDYGVLIQLIEKLTFAEPEWDGTAIGDGLANSVNRIKDSKAKSKVVILLTDGKSNQGNVDPILAAQIAQSFKVKVYTIGVGTQGTAMMPYNDPMFGMRKIPTRVEIDEELLAEISAETEAKYYRATNKDELKNIYNEIDQLEKTKINVKEFKRYSELFFYFLLAGFFFFIVEFILANTWFQKLP